MTTPSMDVPTLVRIITDENVGRMASLEISDMELDENAGILYDFNYIAANMMRDEQAVPAPGSTEPGTPDDELIMTTLRLFSEGVCFAMGKCLEMGITGEPKKIILQNLAMEVYTQAKQIIASTYGQEHTPNFQFSHDQQVMMIHQSSEGHLLFFISEYEKEHGPILIADSTPPPPRQEATPAPEPEPPVISAPPPEPYVSPVPSRRTAPEPTAASTANMQDYAKNAEKYAAIALLLTTLNAGQSERILRSFVPEEREWIVYYGDIRNIRTELNFKAVQTQLEQFKDWLEKNRRSTPSKAAQHLAKLTKAYSRETVFGCFNDERSTVKRYLDSYYAPPQAPIPPWRQPLNRFRNEKGIQLPPKVEDILYRYLARRLETESSSRVSSRRRSS